MAADAVDAAGFRCFCCQISANSINAQDAHSGNCKVPTDLSLRRQNTVAAAAAAAAIGFPFSSTASVQT